MYWMTQCAVNKQAVCAIANVRIKQTVI